MRRRFVAGLATSLLLAAPVLIAAEVYARFFFIEIIDRDPAFSTSKAEQNCFPFNKSGRAELQEFVQSSRAFAPTGFRNPPNVIWTGENAAGQAWTTYTNFEGARIASAREQTVSRKDSKILIYGDSFAAAAEVNYEQSWYSLLQEIGKVGNFGIYGGAPDQALGYLKHHLASGFRPDIVIVEMIPENVNRLPSIYHCFLYPESNMRSALKPHYSVKSGERPTLSPAPVTLADLKTIVEDDFWGRRLAILKDIRTSGGTLKSLYAFLMHNSILRDPHGYLLRSNYTSDALREMIEELSFLSKKFSFHTYFVVLPTNGDEFESAAVDGFIRMVSSLASDYKISFIDGFVLLRPAFDKGLRVKYNIVPNKGHMSVEANKYLGERVLEILMIDIADNRLISPH